MFVDPNLLWVMVAVVLLSGSAAMVGCFAFVRKRALIGDAVAHAVLPGICLGFMVGGKSPWVLLLGAILMGWVSLFVMDWVLAHSKLKADTVIGVILSVFFGWGIMLLTAIQQSGDGQQAGLDKYLFGKAAAMTGEEVRLFAGLASLTLLVLVLFFRVFRMISFDADFARVQGLPVNFLHFLLSTLTILSVATGIQAVGVVLMAALLITPAAAARFWTHRLGQMMILAAIFGMASGVGGTWVSYLAPAMPTGPWIVMFLSLIALFSVCFAPTSGILARNKLQRQNRQKILRENILKTCYNLAPQEAHHTKALLAARNFSAPQLKSGLRWLHQHHHLIRTDTGAWQLTNLGRDEAMRIVRLHRLWELYLNRRLDFKPDHVHNGAEALEHLLTPEVEKQLLEELDYPIHDPHQSIIPYRSGDSGRGLQDTGRDTV